MCEQEHPFADAALGRSSHDHEEAAEAALYDAAANGDPHDASISLRLAEVEAHLALARNVGRIAAVLELVYKTVPLG